MKRVLCLLMPALVLLGACKKFLDQPQPADFIQPASFYQTQAQVLQALAGVYSSLIDETSGNGGNLYGWFMNTQGQGASDEMGQRFSAFTAGVNSGTETYVDQYMVPFYTQCYVGINRANILLAATIGPAVDTTLVRHVIAEARFMRGYYHFLLMQNFGGLVLRTTPTTSALLNTPRASLQETYALIKSDMQAALPDLYQMNDNALANTSSRVSQTTCEGILARVCLYMAGPAPMGLADQSQYDSAKIFAEAVINSGLHSLTTNADTMAFPNIANLRGTPLAYPAINGNPAYHNNGYAQNFLYEAMAKYNTKENMWEADFAYGGAAADRRGFIGYNMGQSGSDPAVTGGSGGNWYANPYLYASYIDSNDLRRDWSFCPYTLIVPTTANPAGKTFAKGDPSVSAAAIQIATRTPAKWRIEVNPNVNGFPAAKPSNRTTIKFPILRYADVILMAAEAELMTGDVASATDHINWVRRRAYGIDNYTAPPDSATGPGGKYQYCDVPNDYSYPDAYAQYFPSFSAVSIDLIMAERSRELCFEDLRPYDLKRWNVSGGSNYLNQLANANNFNNTAGPNGGSINGKGNMNNNNIQMISGGAKVLLWPIPATELNVNKAAVQNPGW